MNNDKEPVFDFEGYDAKAKLERISNIGARVAHTEDVLDIQESEIGEIERNVEELLQDAKDANARHGFKS